ncbi:MAG: hypothetical protein PHF76_10860 [Bacteroidales bacterium]|nr:hypothetical protein [Bacteroidales bacterium]
MKIQNKSFSIPIFGILSICVPFIGMFIFDIMFWIERIHTVYLPFIVILIFVIAYLRRERTLYCLIGALLTISYIMLHFIPCTVKPTPYLVTSSRYYFISKGLKLLSEKDENNWNELESVSKEILAIGNEDSLEINKRVLSAFRAIPLPELLKYLRVEEMTKGSNLLCDGWGTPFCFMQINNAEYYKLHPTLRWGANHITFWSAGKNKTNEFGYGDDFLRCTWYTEREKERRLLLRKTYLDALYAIEYNNNNSEIEEIQSVEDLRVLLRNTSRFKELEAYGASNVFFNPDFDLWDYALSHDVDIKGLKDPEKGYSEFAIILETEGQYFGVRFNHRAENGMTDVPMWARKWDKMIKDPINPD